jgi:hypothetical protein
MWRPLKRSTAANLRTQPPIVEGHLRGTGLEAVNDALGGHVDAHQSFARRHKRATGCFAEAPAA